MKTRKLFYEDVYLGKFEAKVLECRERKGGFAVVLDQTAFYPEGGGQPADTGYFMSAVRADQQAADYLPDAEYERITVKDVQEAEGELLHFTDRPLAPGQIVHGVIDWERRFDLMQQHSGEHIVSGLVHGKYGYDNVGFHMGSDVITIDFNGVLTEEELLEIENEANRYIWEDRRSEITYPAPEELEKIPYRSKKELTGQVRIVTFPGVDICACCGLHVARTGEIGMVKLLSVVHFREGVRVEMIAGKRVLSYLQMIKTQNSRISESLSAKPGETAQAVVRLLDENYRLKGSLHSLEEELFRTEASRWEGYGSVLLFRSGLEADSVRKLCDAVMKTCRGCCAVFSDNGDGTYKYAMGEENGDLRTFTKEMNTALNGRGGGKPFFVQGSVKAGEEEIRRFFSR